MISSFKNLVSVTYMGKIIVIANGNSEEQSKDLFFNVLDLTTTSLSDADDWTGFRKVSFTNQLRPAGMSIITLDEGASLSITPADAPFRVVSDEKYLTIFRQSAYNTIYANRYTLISTPNDRNPDRFEYSLQPAWEVRFERSGKEDVPANEKDTQSYLSPEKRPFLEPTIELSMMSEVSDGKFSVSLLPIMDTSTFCWQFTIFNMTTNKIDLYNIPAGDNNIFDLTGKQIGPDNRLLPDRSFSIVIKGNTDTPFQIENAPTSCFYSKQEKVINTDGKTSSIKRAGRFMLALSGYYGTTPSTVFIDASVSTSGTLAAIPENIGASAIEPANYTLQFDGISCVKLSAPSPNPLEIKGPFTLSTWIHPTQRVTGKVFVIGAIDPDNPADSAPYLALIDGAAIEVGFGDGTRLVLCKTIQNLVSLNNWFKVEIEYKGTMANPFIVKVNNSIAELTDITADKNPKGIPLSLISASDRGFVGLIDETVITVAGNEVCRFSFNSVDYSHTPPLTKNSTAGSKIIGEVFGATLLPSNCPLSTNTTGELYIDENNLTVNASVADFLTPAASPFIMEGSDGLLHFYYSNKTTSEFAVANYSLETSRASFRSDWNAESDSGIQTGMIKYIASKSGAYYNSAVITIENSFSPNHCNLSIESVFSETTEKFIGIPRKLDAFLSVLSGKASDSPDEISLNSGNTVFFDYNGHYPGVWAPTDEAAEGDNFVFITRFIPVPLASVEITDNSAKKQGTVNVGISLKPEHWKVNSDIEQFITQSWEAIPTGAKSFTDVLNGNSSSYNYHSDDFSNCTVVYLKTLSGQSAKTSNLLTVFIQKNKIPDFSVVIDGTDQVNCDMTVTAGGNTYRFSNVQRDQNQLTALLNGQGTVPEGYVQNVARYVFARSNGLLLSVCNQAGQSPVDNMLAGAMLFSLFFTGDINAGSYVTPMISTHAGIVQQGKGTIKNKEVVLVNGSALFTIVADTKPTNGAMGMVRNIDCAPLLIQAADGGWIREPNRFALEFNNDASLTKSNYVTVDVSKSRQSREILAIDGDLTVESWGRPLLPRNGEFISKLLSSNIKGNIKHPEMSFQYMTGFQNWYVPSFRMSTFAFTSVKMNEGTLSNITLNGFFYIDSSAKKGGDLFGLSTNLQVKEFLTVSSDQNGYLSLSFIGEKELTGKVATDQWAAIGVTLAALSDSIVEIVLYTDGNPSATKTITLSGQFTDELGTLFVGGYLNGTGMQMKTNQLALWPRPLDSTAMKRISEEGISLSNNPPLICLNLNDGPNTQVAKNCSYLGAVYDGQYQNIDASFWSRDSIFMSPFAANAREALVAPEVGCKAWTHCAFVFRQGFCLDCDNDNYVDCGNDSSLNIIEKASLECWLKPLAEAGRFRNIAYKNGSYTLGLYPDGSAFFTLTIETDDGNSVVNVKASTPIMGGQTGYLVITTEVKSIQQPYEEGKPASPKYGIYLNLYLNGQLSGSFKKEDFKHPVRIVGSDDNLYLCGSPELNQMYNGKIGEVRFWNRELLPDEIAGVYKNHQPPVLTNGLISYWRFSEMKGKTAFDSKDVNNAIITSSELWKIFPEIATTALYVNGATADVECVDPSEFGGYGDEDRFTIGSEIVNTAPKFPMSGGVDEVRIWTVQLTGEQISDSMNRTLSGTETGLACYWRFDSGSGLEVKDQTGRGNNGTFVPADSNEAPKWIASDAPISNEAPVVYNALNGIKTLELANISGQPSVIEYADIQKDAYGTTFSVMKRAYIYFDKNGSRQVLYTGYKIGDLDTVYLGQIQTKPSIIGFIEGAPPIPSENQTAPYWSDSPTDTGNYGEATSMEMTEASQVEYGFSVSENKGLGICLSGKLGLVSEGDFSTSVGVGTEVQKTVFEYEVFGGIQASLNINGNNTEERSLKNNSSVNMVSSFTPGGSWENPAEMINNAVGLRYLTYNTGVAIVKSSAADLYMIALKGTNTPVKYTIVPNEDIPEDMNLIPFPINKKYIKNGTLDGKVGLKNDPDFPDADLVRGSYFNPIEAYSLKRKIERKEKALEGFYQQFSTSGGMTLKDFTKKVKDNPAFDWTRKLSSRNIVNTYVWSSDGAGFSEQKSVMDTYSENFSGVSSFETGVGIFAGGKIKKPIGPLRELDLMLHFSFEKTATKSKESFRSFELNCSVNPDRTLTAPVIGIKDGKPVLIGTTTEPAPGKVDSYRYLAFYLTPSQENFQVLRNTVIDPFWFNNSVDSNAIALRQAIVNENGCWRVLYRVTFVKRIPAQFQPVKSETQAPNITSPANTNLNSWLIQIIDKAVGKPNPTVEEIGCAIQKTIGINSVEPGILEKLLPWWREFLDGSQIYGTAAYKKMIELREDLLKYMINKYATERL